MGRYVSWAWLAAAITMDWADEYDIFVLIANVLHFNHELLVNLGEVIGYEISIKDIDLLGMFAFEYFLQMAIVSAVMLALFGAEQYKSPFIIAMLFAPAIVLLLEELTAPFITYTPTQLEWMFYAEAIFDFMRNRDRLDLFIWQVGLDALYKYAIYTLSVPEDNSFELNNDDWGLLDLS